MTVPVPGFTLLELIVVLVLVGLVTTLALPNLERLYAGLTRKTERDFILDQLAGLGRQAMLQGRAYVVFGTDDAQEAELSGSTWETGDAQEAELSGSTWETGDAQEAGPSGPAREAGDAASGGERVPLAGHASGPSSHAGHERYVIDLPEGWEIRLEEPLVVRANGVCLGGELTLYHRGAVDVRLGLEPPYCRIDAGT